MTLQARLKILGEGRAQHKANFTHSTMGRRLPHLGGAKWEGEKEVRKGK
jgi:hypothetical protein